MDISSDILEKNIEKEEAAQIVRDIVYLEYLDLFKKHTLKAILGNKFAPAFGWAGDFRNKEEYINFIDRIIYLEDGFTEEYIVKNIIRNIKDYKSENELQEDLEWYGSLEPVAEDIFYDLSMEDIISFMTDKVISDIKSGRLAVEGIFDELFCYYYYNRDFEELVNDPDELFGLAKKYGLYDNLVKILTKEEEDYGNRRNN